MSFAHLMPFVLFVQFVSFVIRLAQFFDDYPAHQILDLEVSEDTHAWMVAVKFPRTNADAQDLR